MSIAEFKQQIKLEGLGARKINRREVFQVTHNRMDLFTVTYAELHPIAHIKELYATKLPRKEYIPLG